MHNISKYDSINLPSTTNMGKRVLIIAMCCNSEKGSEWAVGWDFIDSLSKNNRLYIIAAEEDRKEIEKNSKFKERNVEFHFIKVGWEERKFDNTIMRQLEFDNILCNWHDRALELATKLVKDYQIELVHKLTPCGFRSPGEYWKLDVPSVWGPVTGISRIPISTILSDLPLYARLKLFMKMAISPLDFRFKKKVHHAFRQYDAIISGSSFAHEKIKSVWNKDCPVIIQSGLPEEFIVIDAPNPRSSVEPIKISWVGKMLPRKNLHLVLESLSKLEANIKWELHVVGDGPMYEPWKKHSLRLGLDHKVIFYGRLPRNDVFEVMKKSHLLVTLSSLDSAPGVVFEAYGCGLPVISLDIPGFRDVVTSSTGFRISSKSRESISVELGEKIKYLVLNEIDRIRLATNSINTAKFAFYDEKAKIINRIYNDLKVSSE